MQSLGSEGYDSYTDNQILNIFGIALCSPYIDEHTFY